jgi:hypothetical protein
MTLRNDSLLDADYFEYAELKEKKTNEISIRVPKTMTGHLISGNLGLSHQADHECSENYHLSTYRYAPGGEKEDTLL